MGQYVIYDPEKWNDAKMAKKCLSVQTVSKGKLKEIIKTNGPFKKAAPIKFNVKFNYGTGNQGMMYKLDMPNDDFRAIANSTYDLFCKNMKTIGLETINTGEIAENPHYKELKEKIGWEGTTGGSGPGTWNEAKFGPYKLHFFKIGTWGVKERVMVNSAGQKIMEEMGADSIMDIDFDLSFSIAKKNVYAPVLKSSMVMMGQYIPYHTPIVKMSLKKPIAHFSNNGIVTAKTKAGHTIDKEAFLSTMASMFDRLSMMYVTRLNEVYDKFR